MKVNKLNNALVEHKMTILRNKKTNTKEVRELVSELSTVLCYEAMRDAKLNSIMIETPVASCEGKKLIEDNYAFVPILRAGMGMIDGILSAIPHAKVGHIGMYRNEETFQPVNYFFKVPKNIEDKEVILLDPMLATGGSAVDSIQLLKDKGVKKIKFLCIVASREGVLAVNEKHPDVEIFAAAVDDLLNADKYIIPGLGDAGDRIYGTI